VLGQGRQIEEVRTLGRRGHARLAALAALLALVGAAGSPAGASATSAPGQLYAFGLNENGQLGSETNWGSDDPNPTPLPVTLPGASGPVTAAAAGWDFSLVVAGGRLYSFGENGWGQLGYHPQTGESAESATPRAVTLPGATGPVTAVAAGDDSSLAVAGGQLYAFGHNNFEELGTTARIGLPNATPAPVALPGASGPVTQVAAGGFGFSLALTATGQLYTFGDNLDGELGGGASRPGLEATPETVALPGATGPVAELAGGGFFSLAATSTGQLYAFGSDGYGQLGSPPGEHPEAPHPTPTLVRLPGEVGPVTQVAAGEYDSLALTAGGQLYAFGYDRQGQLGFPPGDELEAPHPTPMLVRLPGATGRIVRIAAGDDFSLALTSTGELYAFGEDRWGQLGFPPSEQVQAPHPAPTRVALPGPNAETIATGSLAEHTLVVMADLAVSTSSLPAGEAGAAYSAQAQATGGAPPYRWSARGLPSGLSIDPTTGSISGTPGAGGRYTPTIVVTDGDGIEASASPVLTVTPLPAGAPGEAAPSTARRAPRSSALPAAHAAAPSSTAARSRHQARLAAAHQPVPWRAGGGAGFALAPFAAFPGTMPSATARATAPSVRADTSGLSSSAWVVHEYTGHVTEAGGAPLKVPVGLAFDSKGDLYVADADQERHGYVYRFGPTGALECEIGGGFPYGQLESISVDDETGVVYVAEDDLVGASIWLLKPAASCYQTPIGFEYGILTLSVDNGPGPDRGDAFLLSRVAPYGNPVPFYVKTNAGGLVGSESELPEPPGEFSIGGEPETLGRENTTSELAVDPSSGTIYVTNPQSEAVDVYNKENELQTQTLTTGEKNFQPIAVAVDPSDGDVYVVDAVHKIVDEFDAAGELIGKITGAGTPQGKFVDPRNVAVKPGTHEVYVADEGARAIDIFSANETAPLPAAPTTEAPGEVGAEGATLNGAVEHAEGEPLSWFYRYARGASCTGGNHTAGTTLAAGETGLLHEPAQLGALEPSTEYTACFADEEGDGALGLGAAAHFETQGLAPAEGAVSITGVWPSTATLGGTLNAENQATKYRFEYATDPAFTGAQVADEATVARGTYPAASLESAVLAGLAPDTTYYVRLYAENATGHFTSAATSFTTPSPTQPAIEAWSASEGETVSQETLEGVVNTAHQPTTCTFQYTTETAYVLQGFAGAASAPCTGGAFGSPPVAFSEAVNATATGLQPGVTYDYRLAAENAAGRVEAPLAPATFTTVGPPSPATGGAEHVSPNSAMLTGTVNPDRLASSYHYEYASEAVYAKAKAEGRENPYAGGLSTPDSAVGAGESREALPATAISGLQPDTTYHYRLLATNEAGTRYGQDQTLTTAAEGPTSTTEGNTTPSPPTTSTSPPAHSAPSPPAVQDARQSATSWRESNRLASISRAKTPTGTTFSFSLNEQATVRFSFNQLLGGTSAAHSCLAKTREDARRKSCNTASRGTLSFTCRAGTNRVAFAGRISRTDKLKPGRYVLTITATNAAGQNSAPVSLRFTIVK
jgi:alpha-tubulin suppressor-like RCC1 family protein